MSDNALPIQQRIFQSISKCFLRCCNFHVLTVEKVTLDRCVLRIRRYTHWLKGSRSNLHEIFRSKMPASTLIKFHFLISNMKRVQDFKLNCRSRIFGRTQHNLRHMVSMTEEVTSVLTAPVLEQTQCVTCGNNGHTTIWTRPVKTVCILATGVPWSLEVIAPSVLRLQKISYNRVHKIRVLNKVHRNRFVTFNNPPEQRETGQPASHLRAASKAYLEKTCVGLNTYFPRHAWHIIYHTNSDHSTQIPRKEFLCWLVWWKRVLACYTEFNVFFFRLQTSCSLTAHVYTADIAYYSKI
jgi:hypothetical protein